jgi:hypothetical protein
MFQIRVAKRQLIPAQTIEGAEGRKGAICYTCPPFSKV